ncbi:hypothetical protein MHYP_G00359180 [Metynnis hypsauchen]
MRGPSADTKSITTLSRLRVQAAAVNPDASARSASKAFSWCCCKQLMVLQRCKKEHKAVWRIFQASSKLDQSANPVPGAEEERIRCRADSWPSLSHPPPPSPPGVLWADCVGLDARCDGTPLNPSFHRAQQGSSEGQSSKAAGGKEKSVCVCGGA